LLTALNIEREIIPVIILIANVICTVRIFFLKGTLAVLLGGGLPFLGRMGTFDAQVYLSAFVPDVPHFFEDVQMNILNTEIGDP